MRRIRATTIWIALSGCVCCAFIFLYPGSQPSYKHRSLQQWLESCPDGISDYETYGGPGPNALEVQAAVRAMGTKAVPTLMGMFTARDSALKRGILKFLPHWVPFHPHEAQQQQHLAERGLWLLGPQALPALPVLTNLIRQPDTDTQLRSLGVLIGITTNREVLLPVLTERLKDPDWQVRAVAEVFLERYCSTPSQTNVVVPVE